VIIGLQGSRAACRPGGSARPRCPPPRPGRCPPPLASSSPLVAPSAGSRALRLGQRLPAGIGVWGSVAYGLRNPGRIRPQGCETAALLPRLAAPPVLEISTVRIGHAAPVPSPPRSPSRFYLRQSGVPHQALFWTALPERSEPRSRNQHQGPRPFPRPHPRVRSGLAGTAARALRRLLLGHRPGAGGRLMGASACRPEAACRRQNDHSRHQITKLDRIWAEQGIPVAAALYDGKRRPADDDPAQRCSAIGPTPGRGLSRPCRLVPDRPTTARQSPNRAPALTSKYPGVDKPHHPMHIQGTYPGLAEALGIIRAVCTNLDGDLGIGATRCPRHSTFVTVKTTWEFRPYEPRRPNSA